MATPATLQLVILALAISSAEEIDQSDIARKIKNGDHDAFQAFFDNQYDFLMRFLLSKNMSEEAAKDLIQQAFIYIWEHRNGIDPGKSLRAYLFKIAYTRMLNMIRDNKKFAEQPITGNLMQGTTPQDKLRHSDLMGELRKTITKMPEKRSIVFEMCFMQEFTYRETASALDISVKTVENHMVLALKDVRKSLKNMV